MRYLRQLWQVTVWTWLLHVAGRECPQGAAGTREGEGAGGQGERGASQESTQGTGRCGGCTG